MGAYGCKYCHCDREKIESASEEMKIQYNSPINIENENKNQKNNKNNDNNENKSKIVLNQNEDLNLNIQINNEEENNMQSQYQKKDLSHPNPQSNNFNNNDNHNIVIDNANNIIEIGKNNNIIQISTFNNHNNSNNNNNDKDTINIDNNNTDKQNLLQNSNKNIAKENKKNDENKNYPNNNNLQQTSKKEIFPIEENANNKNKNELKESKTGQLSILNSKDVKNKIKKYEIDKIQFGLGKEDKDSLNKEQQKLYNQAQINLQQFNPPKGNEMSQLQSIMSNILIKLKNTLEGIDLNSNKDDPKYILLNGNLKKMINYEINAYNTTMYSERFSVLYPKMLKYYKSKAQFLKSLSPACVLPINQISAVNIAKPKKGNKKIYHLIICNKLGIKKSFNKNIFLNLFDSVEINEYLSSPDLNESLLIFTSDDEKDIYKWYITIRYLIDFSKRQ
jgi:hypothetical protein